MTTIYDIAKKTGISKSTVSRVVSGSGYVSETKRQIILNAMHELGYVPNQMAKNLRSKKSNTIGFLVNDYFPLVGEFIKVFTDQAATYDYNVNVYFTKTAENERKTLDLLTTKALDAVFILTRINSWELISSYTKFGPIATWQRVENSSIYSNYVDHYPIYLKILERLTNKGYQQIGHVFSDLRNGNTRARVQAIKDFSKQHPETDQSYQLFYPGQANAGQDAAEKWLQLSNRPPVMIFFADYVAAEFITTIRKHHLQIPEDCLVIGSDHSEISELMNIPTVDLCFQSQAQNGFIYLYNQLNNTNLPFKTQQPRWIPAY